MSVRKPLEKPKVEQPIDIDALIDKAAKVKEDHAVEESKKWTNLCLRIPVEMLKEVDEAVGNRVGITRTGWILESIHEKLQRQNN